MAEEIIVDVKELELGELERLMGGDVPFAEQLAIIDKILVKPEGGARKIKVGQLGLVIEAVNKELESHINPTTPPAA